jgi:hypothetical protein
MPTKDGFTPEHPLPLFLAQHDEPNVGKVWDRTVISSRILKTSILVVAASVIAILLVENPVALFANVTALLVDKLALQPLTGQSTPTIQSTSAAQDLPPTARNEPARDEIVVAFEPDQRQTESEPPATAPFRQFQAWAAEKEVEAQVGPGQPVQADPAVVAQNAPAKVAENARASPVRPIQKHRHVRLVQNARAEMRPVQWDGLGQPPTADTRSPPAKQRISHNQTKANGEGPASAEPYATGDDLPYDDDRLKQKLVICRGCGAHGDSTPRDKSMTSMPRDWNSD